MKIRLLIIVLFANQSILFAQDKYFISFYDKTGTPYTVDHPEDYLSQKSIDRRTLQGIEISELDLPVNPNYLQQLAATGANVLYPLKWFNGVVITINNPAQLETIQNFNFVNGVTRIFVNGSKGSQLEDDIQENDYHHKFNKSDVYSYGASATQVKMLNGHILHNGGFQGQGKVIAVLDAGFYNVNTLSSFAHLRDNNMILGTRDFVNPQSNIYEEHTHGMLVLSVMAGNLSGQLIGTAPEASYWLIRTEDANTEQLIEEYNWAAGAELADSVGADVINSSLGYTTFDIQSQNHAYNDLDGKTAPISIAADLAAKCGMVVVISAGNEGSGAWYYISAPADAAQILAIGSVNSDESRSSFSSYGPSSDGRIKPDIAAMGGATAVQTTTGSIGTASGTSLSAPVISGLVACLWQALPTKKAEEIRDLVLKSSSNFASPNNSLGYGLPNFNLALNSIEDEVSDKQDIKVVPNPFNNFLTIKFSNEVQGNLNVKLFYSTGQLVYNSDHHTDSNSLELTIPNGFPDGLYLIRVHYKNNMLTGKAIKKSSPSL